MALRHKVQLKGGKKVYYVGWNPQTSKDGLRPAASFSIRHPKEGDARAHIEHVPAEGFAFWADFDNLRQGWEERYQTGSNKPPIRKPDTLPLVRDGDEPLPPDGYEADGRTPKNGWRQLLHLPIVLADGRQGVLEVSNFGGRRAIENALDHVNKDPDDHNDAWAFFRCAGAYYQMTKAGGTMIPQFILEHWSKPDAAAPMPQKRAASPPSYTETPDTPIAAEVDPAAATAPQTPGDSKMRGYLESRKQKLSQPAKRTNLTRIEDDLIPWLNDEPATSPSNGEAGVLRTAAIESENAVIVLHSCIVATMVTGDGFVFNPGEFGHHRISVRHFKVLPPARYAQYDKAIVVRWMLPKKRTWEGTTIVPNGLRYCTIERDGEILYDTRTELPIDMEQFNATREKDCEKWRAITARRP